MLVYFCIDALDQSCIPCLSNESILIMGLKVLRLLEFSNVKFSGDTFQFYFFCTHICSGYIHEYILNSVSSQIVVV